MCLCISLLESSVRGGRTGLCCHLLDIIRQFGGNRGFQIKVIQTARQAAEVFAERFEFLAQVLACAAHLGDIPAAVRGLVVEVVEQVLQIAERGLYLLKQLLVLGHVRAGLLKGGEDAARGGVERGEGVLCGVQLRNERVGLAGQLIEGGERRVRARVDGAAVADELLAHLVDARNALAHRAEAALNRLHGAEHAADAGIEVVARVFEAVLDVAHTRHDVERGGGRRGHEHDKTHALEVVRADANGEGVFLARQAHEHDELVGAERLDLCAGGVNGERLAHVDAGRADQHHVVLVVFACVVVRNGVNVHLDGAARAGALVGLDRNAVQLVGHIEVPRHLDIDRVVRDTLIVEALLVGVELPVDRAVLEHRLVKGRHIVNVLVVSEIGELGVAVEVYALDDACVGRHAVVVHVDVYGLVGFDCRSGGVGALRQRKRKQKCGRGDAAQLISFHCRFPPCCSVHCRSSSRKSGHSDGHGACRAAP